MFEPLSPGRAECPDWRERLGQEQFVSFFDLLGELQADRL
jgi:hypothetical protein